MMDREIKPGPYSIYQTLLLVYNKVMYNFRKQSNGKPTVDRNLPLMCGQLKWSQELRSKMSFSVKNFKQLSHPVCYQVTFRKAL